MNNLDLLYKFNENIGSNFKILKSPEKNIFIEWVENNQLKVEKENCILNEHFNLSVSPTILANITCFQKVSQNDHQRIYQVDLDIKNYDWNFLPGDTISILPENLLQDVNILLDLLNLKNVRYKKCHISTNKKLPKHLPILTTPQELFQKILDFKCLPKKNFLRCLSDYTTNETEKNRLLQLSSTEGSNDYKEEILNKSRTFFDILKVFTSCQPPLERLLEHLPRLKPRPYSIASSPTNKHILTIIFSVYENGICTKWLEQIYLTKYKTQSLELDEQIKELSITDDSYQIPIFLRTPDNFQFDLELKKPIILIATGTGIAPFMSFLNYCHLKLWGEEIWLFYGNRYKNYPFKDQLEHYRNSNILTRLFLAFSREKQTKFKYIQDYFKQNITLDENNVSHKSIDQNILFNNSLNNGEQNVKNSDSNVLINTKLLDQTLKIIRVDEERSRISEETNKVDEANNLGKNIYEMIFTKHCLIYICTSKKQMVCDTVKQLKDNLLSIDSNLTENQLDDTLNKLIRTTVFV